MRRFNLFLTAALSAIIALAACSRYETVKGDPLGTKIYTLDNGLQLYMSVNKEQPRIQTYIAVKVGSKNDPSETTGLAHYFEHLMFKGTEQFGTSDYAAEKPMLDEIEQLFEVYRKTTDEAARKAIYHRIDSISYEASKIAIPNEYDKLMAVIGADGTNAWTSADETVYTEDIPSNQIDSWARIQADRFRNTVVRGFHTELETIYEEKNMSLTKDNRKVWEALDKALFPNHPYGRQTTLGTQEHLKNPSITNVKKYHDTYYVPNNIRICVSGDFNPDEMVAAVEKYFGDWQPNPDIPELDFPEEEPICEPVVRDVYGLESEYVTIGWRLPGAADLKTAAVAEIAGSILYNGQAGIIDLNVNQRQKVLGMFGGYSSQPDYGQFIMMGEPKQGQTLEEVRDIALASIDSLRNGCFDEEMIKSVINNEKLSAQQMLEDNSSRAHKYVNAFIDGISWRDACKKEERLAVVTAEDVIAFANEYLKDDNYAIIYKRQGVDDSVQKISAPAITPIVTNRDKESGFLASVKAAEVAPIEPVFVDFSRDMSRFDLAPSVEVLYKENELNDIFSLEYEYGAGRESNPELSLACDYISYLGTDTYSADEIATRMYDLACDFSAGAGTTTSVYISGLSENMEEAIGIVEDLILNAVPDEEILQGLKEDIIKSRIDNKTSQSACFNALRRYISFGPEFIRRTTLTNDEIMALTSEQLLSSLRSVFAAGHTVKYYGPLSEASFKEKIGKVHTYDSEAAKIEEIRPVAVLPGKSSVVMAQYDAKQIYYYQYSNRGEELSLVDHPAITLYNEYFGGGMNTVVFQEMREARGLAYSAWARMFTPSYAGDTYSYSAFIATQNDKMKTAIEAFDEIINNMPVSEKAFIIAKESLISRLRTQRVNGAEVLDEYTSCRRKGLDEPLDRCIYEGIQNLTLEDVAAVQQSRIKGRSYTYGILGDIKDLNVGYLRTLGPVKVVSLEEIFGY